MPLLEKSKIKVKRQWVTERFALYNGDSCQALQALPDESIGLCIHSPPFASLYGYSDSLEDLSNCKDYDEFFVHYRFIAEQLFRIMLPGRNVAVHCMDLPTFKRDGEEIAIKDFPGDIIRMFVDVGFIFHSRHCIWKDPLDAAFRTKAIGLAHKQICKDSAMCRTGIPDYIVTFRKPGENPIPVAHPDGLDVYYGARSIPNNLDRFMEVNPITGEPWKPKDNKRSHWIWQQYASPVWFDVRHTRVLPYKGGKDPDDARHVCPFATDTVYRCMELWSTKNDKVLDCFSGCGTVTYCAVKTGRFGIGIDLKQRYHRQACRNLAGLTGNKYEED